MTGRICFRSVLAACLLGTGCKSLDMRTSKTEPAQPKSSGDVEHFLASWNANAQKIQSLHCDHVDIDGKSQGQIYQLNAKLAYQPDNRFRLLGKFAGKSEVDLGSNDQEIWFWIARAQPPAVYFCPRDELANVKLTTPFQPEWVIEGMGVRPMDPNVFHPGKGDNWLCLIAHQRTPSGKPVIKQVLVNRQTNRVEYFRLFDTESHLLAEVKVESYYDDPATQIFVPRRLKVRWPEAETSLTITMQARSIKFNSINDDLAKTLFKRGEYLNSESINLAQVTSGRPNSTSQVRTANGAWERQAQLPDPAPSRRPRAAELTGTIQSGFGPGAN